MGFCAYCGNWVDEGDICGHCGGSGGGDEKNYKQEVQVNPIDECCKKAEKCSQIGEHSAAIKFYTEALRLSESDSNCKVLSAIADEYEAMGDYALAEEYWRRCTAVKRYDSYAYIAGKGDFFNRRERYREALDVYGEALNEMDGIYGAALSYDVIEYYARVSHFIIDCNKLLENGNLAERYHSRLKHAIEHYLHLGMTVNDKTDAYFLYA